MNYVVSLGVKANHCPLTFPHPSNLFPHPICQYGIREGQGCIASIVCLSVCLTVWSLTLVTLFISEIVFHFYICSFVNQDFAINFLLIAITKMHSTMAFYIACQNIFYLFKRSLNCLWLKWWMSVGFDLNKNTST